jgi:hypothetical protein
LGEYIRSWRVQNLSFWIGQAIVPAAQVEWKPSLRWTASANFAFQRGEGFHNYDNVQSTVLISYNKPFRRSVSDSVGLVPVEYPVRFSFGLQSANYYSFPGHGQNILRPVVRITLF